MKIGDIVTDFNGDTWLVYDLSDDGKYLYVTDIKNHSKNEYISTLIIINVEKKPTNVQWLFLARREKNLKGLEMFL